MYGWTDGRLDGQTEGWTNGRTVGRTKRSKTSSKNSSRICRRCFERYPISYKKKTLAAAILEMKSGIEIPIVE